MGAKSKPQEVLSLADIGAEAGHVGEAGSRTPSARRAAAPEERPGEARGRRQRRGEDRRVPRGEEAHLMTTLVFLETHDGEPTKGGLGVLSKAAALGGEVAGRARDGRPDAAAKAGAHGATRSSSSRTTPSPRRSRNHAWTRSRRSWPSPARRTFSLRPPCSGRHRLGTGRAPRRRTQLGLHRPPRGRRRARRQCALRSATRCSSRWAGRRRRASALVRSGTFDPDESRRHRGGARRVGDVPGLLDAGAARRPSAGEISGPSIEDADVIVAGGRGLGGPGGLLDVRGARSGARRRRRRDARRRGCRLVPVLGPGRADGQDRLAEALHRARHLRRDPAQGRDAGGGDDRRDQQGSERPYLRLRRPRRRRRPDADRPKLTELLRARK